MKKVILALALAALGALMVPLAVSAHPGQPGSAVGPPGGTFYAFDQAYTSTVTPAHVPNRGQFDAFYVFPDCPTCSPVSDSAPGTPGYNGGRWAVIQAFGITSQLTNSDDVVSQATSLVDTGHRFVCPLIRI